MSDIMLFGVLRMPFDMAMRTEISRVQFYDRAQEAASRIEALEAALKTAREEAMEAAAKIATSFNEEADLDPCNDDFDNDMKVARNTRSNRIAAAIRAALGESHD